MTDLAFTVLDVVPEPYGAAPALLFRVRLTESTGATVHAIALRAQVQIEPQRRAYAETERGGLACRPRPPACTLSSPAHVNTTGNQRTVGT